MTGNVRVGKRFRLSKRVYEWREEDMLNLLGSSRKPVFVHADHQILYVNPAMTELLGLTGEVMMGQPLHSLVFPSGSKAESAGTDGATVERIWRHGQLMEMKAVNLPFNYKGKPSRLVMLEEDVQEGGMETGAGGKKVEQQHYESLVEHNPAAISSLDLQGVIRTANPAMEAMSGFTAKELIGTHLLQMIDPADVAHTKLCLEQTIQGKPANCEMVFYQKDGTAIDIGVKFVPIIVNGVISGIYYIGKNITHRKKAEQELRHTKVQLESLFTNTSDAIMIFDRAAKVLKVNPAFEKMYGWTAEQVLGQQVPLLPPDKWQEIERACDHVVRHGSLNGIEMEFIRKDGARVQTSVTLSPIEDGNGNIVAFAAMSRDVSERIRMEKSLRESEAKYRLIAENMSDLIAIYDREGRITYASPSFKYILGEEPDLKQKVRIEQWVHAHDRKRIRETFDKMVDTQQAARFEYRYTTSRKQNIYLEASGIPVMGESRQVDGVVVVSRDITTRKKTEAALQEAEEKYRSLVEEALVGVYLIQDWEITYVNPRCAEMLGYTREDMFNKSVHNYIYPDDIGKLTKKIRQRKGKSVHFFFRALHKDGRAVDVELHGTMTTYKEKPAIIGTVMDITERIKTEELLRKSDKLSVVGQLAAGVAHEIRNPLTSLKGFVQLLKAKKQGQEQYLDIMLSELDRINYIVSEFMVIAKPQVINFRPKDVNRILWDVIPLLDTQAIMNNVQIQMKAEKNLPHIHCDENQLKQVFINILKNAIESMPTGGKIRIKVKGDLKGKLQVRIIDQGSGIAPDRLPQLGEPFYTTKEKGTGLGLMVCYKIIEMHRGTIKIKSKLNQGTTVDITLPAFFPPDPNSCQE
ncbi:PAS domain S-box protein [Paenibacillus sp. J2TS4]|uniref:PAS domain S-box protein n=1 Tax=Paenibacillus sp. J2TS4 TaxID=2807194 RepID=UPI001AFCF2C3|nr:PAS domain S-box protein [Paenibacillus sp. J2TS4]GIP32742.1 hypothetical protein J2TS4_19520 [Paenibacillus sp. J2TS4]